MVEVGIVGYTPLNGHPYSFGSIINGFNENIELNEYPQIASYLKENLLYKEGIEGMYCTSVYCEDYERSIDISSKIKAKPIKTIDEFPKSTDIILILCDYSHWRKNIINTLNKNHILFVDKPLLKNQQEFNFYKNSIKDMQILSSSMFIHETKLKDILFNDDLREIDVNYFGTWDNYSSHAIDPIVKVLNQAEILDLYRYSDNSIIEKNKNLKIIFRKSIHSRPSFEYKFLYKNKNVDIVRIDSNFNCFRNGILSIKNSIQNNIIYRNLDEYKLSLEFYELLKNE